MTRHVLLALLFSVTIATSQTKQEFSSTEKYRLQLITETDKYTGETTISSPYSMVDFTKYITNGKAPKTAILLTTHSSICEVSGKGVIILLDNGQKIVRPQLRIDCDVNRTSGGFRYTAFFYLTEAEMILLCSRNIEGFKLYIFNQDVPEPDRHRGYLSAIRGKKEMPTRINKVLEKWSNGSKMEERIYKDGALNGLATRWHENGQKWEEKTYIDGVVQSPVTSWYETGKKFEVSEVNSAGILNGLTTRWYENGNICFEKMYINGGEGFITHEWYENGQSKLECSYSNKLLVGMKTEWYENGQKKFEGNYINGKEDGVITVWFEDGQIKSTTNYILGRKMSLY